MNIYKIRRIVEWIRANGKLPTDAYGEVLSPDNLLGWFGLNEVLTVDEQEYMRKELAAMVEAELSLEDLRLSKQFAW